MEMKWVEYGSNETPPERQDLLVRYKDTDYFIDKGYYRDRAFFSDDGFRLDLFDITHWMLIIPPES